MSALGARPTRVAQRGGLRRALVLIIGTIVWPGSAQFLAGSRRLCAIVMGLWVVLLVSLSLMWFRFRPDRVQLIDWVTDPGILGTARLVGLVAVVLWMLLFIDAGRLVLVICLGWW